MKVRFKSGRTFLELSFLVLAVTEGRAQQGERFSCPRGALEKAVLLLLEGRDESRHHYLRG